MRREHVTSHCSGRNLNHHQFNRHQLALAEIRQCAVHVYRFDTMRETQLKGLRFPFALAWRAERGCHVLTSRLGGKQLGLNAPMRVRTEEMFDVCAIPDETGAASGWLELEIDACTTATVPDWNGLMQAFSRDGGGFGLALAQAMFRLPWYAWRIEDAARALGVTRRSLQMALFRESYSFDAALRRCRRLNQLLREGDARCRFAAIARSVAQEPPFR
jgi:hypothetical protein